MRELMSQFDPPSNLGLVMAGLLAPFLLLGCSSTDDISREEAAAILEEHFNGEEADRINITLRDNAFQEGIEQGYWNQGGSPTAKGADFFIAANSEEGTFGLTAPHTYQIEITGISQGVNGEATQLADFRLSNDGLSGPPRRFAAPFSTGRAEFRHFDDGWRLENPQELTVTYERVIQLELSSDDQAAIASDIADTQRLRTDYISEAQRATERRVFECAISHGGHVARRTITISNVDIRIADPVRSTDESLWFGDMTQWYVEPVMLKSNLTVVAGGGERYTAYFSPCRDWDDAINLLAQQYDAWKARYPDLIHGAR